MEQDLINHPEHYTQGPAVRQMECIDITRHLPFNLGNAVKYVWRAGKKGDRLKALEDLDKAEWYLDDWDYLVSRMPSRVWELWDVLSYNALALTLMLEGADQGSPLDKVRVGTVASIVRGDMDSAREGIDTMKEYIEYDKTSSLPGMP